MAKFHLSYLLDFGFYSYRGFAFLYTSEFKNEGSLGQL